MTVVGSARIIGYAIAGKAAHWSVTGAFTGAAVLCVAAVVLLAVAFAEASPTRADHRQSVDVTK